MVGYVYIGSAAADSAAKYKDIGFLQRWRNHLSSLKKGSHKNRFLQRVSNKYGIDGLRFKIIEICDPKDCVGRENYYLSLYRLKQNVYNVNLFANNRLGAVLSEETKRKISNGRKKKSVFQYSIDGAFIKEYGCLYHVVKEFPTGSGSIWNCLNNRQQTAFGYRWSYELKQVS